MRINQSGMNQLYKLDWFRCWFIPCQLAWKYTTIQVSDRSGRSVSEELYSSTGVNWKALLSVFLGAAPCMPGFINALLVHGEENLVSPFWAHLYSGGSCLFSLGASGIAYLILSSFFESKKSLKETDFTSETAIWTFEASRITSFSAARFWYIQKSAKIVFW